MEEAWQMARGVSSTQFLLAHHSQPALHPSSALLLVTYWAHHNLVRPVTINEGTEQG